MSQRVGTVPTAPGFPSPSLCLPRWLGRGQPDHPSRELRGALSMVLNRRTLWPVFSAPRGLSISGGALGGSILLSLSSN